MMTFIDFMVGYTVSFILGFYSSVYYMMHRSGVEIKHQKVVLILFDTYP